MSFSYKQVSFPCQTTFSLCPSVDNTFYPLDNPHVTPLVATPLHRLPVIPIPFPYKALIITATPLPRHVPAKQALPLVQAAMYHTSRALLHSVAGVE